MTGRLSNQTAIVTGAAQGIGRRIAERLGREGASIVVADVDEQTATSTVDAFETEGITAEFVPCDVSSVADTERMANATVERFGSIDVLVNNAGVGDRTTFTELEPESWNRTIDVNLTGPFNCARAVVPTMIDQDGGRIVTISSIAGRNISYYGGASYTASKWGVIGLTKQLAWELGEHGITANAVCPGPTLTDRMKARISADEVETLKRKVPLGRWSTPDDQADAVLFLVSEAGSYLNGAVLDVDGGILLGVRHEV